MEKTHKIDFENVESKFIAAISSLQYNKLVEKILATKKIFLIGNGGLHFVAGHASTDMTRLIEGKAFFNFDSVGFMTSNANDHGYNQIFIRWLESVCVGIEKEEDVLVIGLSCSGNSANVIDTLKWAEEQKYSTFMISGVKSRKLLDNITELVLDCKYFHTVEVLSLMIFYDVIVKCGSSCPTIEKEIDRKEGFLNNIFGIRT